MDFTLHYTPTSLEWDESIQEEIPAYSETKRPTVEIQRRQSQTNYLHLHTSLTPGDIMRSQDTSVFGGRRYENHKRVNCQYSALVCPSSGDFHFFFFLFNCVALDRYTQADSFNLYECVGGKKKIINQGNTGRRNCPVSHSSFSKAQSWWKWSRKMLSWE